MGNPTLQIKVTEGAASGRVYPLTAPNLSLGRTSPGAASTADFIHLDDDTVSRLHAELRWNDQTQSYTLINRSVTNPTSVNNVLVDQVELRPGDHIRMGECLCHLEPAETSTPEPTRRLKGPISLTSRPPLALRILSGSEAGQQVPFSGIVAALGGPIPSPEAARSGAEKWFDQDIVLNDASLPPRCLQLTWKELVNGFELVQVSPGSVFVTVSRSRGGLHWTAQLSTTEPGILRPDDRVSVASNQFQVVVG